MNKMDNQELVSALADGELQGEAFAAAVTRATTDAAGREAWATYHLVGEVLRSGRCEAGSDPAAFLGRLRERMAAEPALPPVAAVAPAMAPAGRTAANDWLWKLVAGVASVAAFAAVGWNMLGTTAGPAAAPQTAAAPVPAPAVTAAVPAGMQQAAMIRDPRLDELLAAHRQLGGATVLQPSSGFLRNATFEGPAR
jgi:sigma-E factor negative regulatory protein RseA